MTALEESGQEFEVIHYLQTVPTADELRLIVAKLDVKPHELIRKGESVYINEYKGKVLSDEEWIAAMVAHPILIERPIVVAGDKAVIARPTEKINDILGR